LAVLCRCLNENEKKSKLKKQTENNVLCNIMFTPNVLKLSNFVFTPDDYDRNISLLLSYWYGEIITISKISYTVEYKPKEIKSFSET